MIIGVGVAAGVFVAIALIRLLENRLIYFPPRYPTGFVPPQRYGLQVDEVWITTANGLEPHGGRHQSERASSSLSISS